MKMGIWIDHRKAVLVSEHAEGEQVESVLSHVEKHPQRAGDSPLKGAYEALQVPADDKSQRALTAHLNSYYDQVIDKTVAAPLLFIFGPGEAKGELKRRLELRNMGAKIAGVETADKLTDREVAAKVREYLEFQAADRMPDSSRTLVAADISPEVGQPPHRAPTAHRP